MRLPMTLVLLLACAEPSFAQAAVLYCDCGEAAQAPCGNGGDTPAQIGGCFNSTGFKAFLDSTAPSSPSVTADDLVFETYSVPSNVFGLYFMSRGEVRIPFGDGLRCVGGPNRPVFRFAPAFSGTGGVLVHGPGLVATSRARFPIAGHIDAGQTWRFQAWFRDPGGPCGSGFNLSNAGAVTFTL